MGVWNGPVNTHVTTDFFVGAAFGETDALHHQLTAMLETRNLKVEPLIGEVLLLDRNLRIDCFFTTTLQALI
jgi:hypothetical protein